MATYPAKGTLRVSSATRREPIPSKAEITKSPDPWKGSYISPRIETLCDFRAPVDL